MNTQLSVTDVTTCDVQQLQINYSNDPYDADNCNNIHNKNSAAQTTVPTYY